MRGFPQLTIAVTGKLCLAAAIAFAQSTPEMDAGKPGYYSLHSLPEAAMDASDTALLQRERTELNEQAHFYNYDLSTGGWTAEQTFCPLMRDYMMMRFTRAFPNGAQSLFTALLPRAEGRVEIVPVYYRSATPFHSAASSKHSQLVFNRVVASEAATAVSTLEKPWLQYGVCYAEMTSGPVSVLVKAGDAPRMYSVALPAAEISDKSRLTKIRFSNRTAEKSYDSWTIDLNDAGRVQKAAYVEHGAPAPQLNNPQEPREVLGPEPPAPKAKLMHPPPAPER